MPVTYFAGLDGSSPSRSAARWAAGHAARDGASLVLIHVIDARWASAGPSPSEQARRRGVEALERESQILADQFPTLAIRTELLVGDPVDELADAASANDILVVGTHKTGFLRGRALGTRGVQLAASVRSRLVVVPELSTAMRSSVVVGVDPDVIDGPAILAAGAEACARHEPLTLVSSVAMPGVPGALARAECADPATAHRALASAAELVEANLPSLEVVRKVSQRTAAEALLDAGRTASIIVLGSRYTPTGGVPIGTTTLEVLMNLTAPVLVVPDGPLTGPSALTPSGARREG